MVQKKDTPPTETAKKPTRAKGAPVAKAETGAAAKPKTTRKASPAAKKVAAPKAAKDAPAVAALARVSTKDLIFQAPDPTLFPTWSPGDGEPGEGEKVIRRRSRQGRVSVEPEAKDA